MEGGFQTGGSQSLQFRQRTAFKTIGMQRRSPSLKVRRRVRKGAVVVLHLLLLLLLQGGGGSDGCFLRNFTGVLFLGGE